MTLTIEPGVIVKGDAGSGANATALLIARGATLMAEGTATSPIIFTGSADNIQPGSITSPNLPKSTINGLWGGLIICGKAPISADAPAMQIEGIPASDVNGLYGGTDPADNSGVIRYVSIRHGGANIGEGNEINGLTLGGVGSGTTIDHVEVVANQDDGVEFFGGTVDVSDVIVYAAGDDAIDVDQAWSGTLDNFIVICEGTDHALEIDGPEGSMQAGAKISNGSIKGEEGAELGNWRDGALGYYERMYFFDFPDPNVDGRGDLDLSDDSKTNFDLGLLVFEFLEVTLPTGVPLADVMKDGVDAYATSVALGNNTRGADKTVFVGWTTADLDNRLTEF